MSEHIKLPLLSLRGFVIFPNMIINFDVARKKSIQAIEKAMVDNQLIFLGIQKQPIIEEPSKEDISNVGTIAVIKQIMKLHSGNIRVLVEGIERAEIKTYEKENPYFCVKVLPEKNIHVEEDYKNALLRTAQSAFENYVQVNQHIAADTALNISSIDEIGKMADTIAANIHLSLQQKIDILSNCNSVDRLEQIIIILENEVNITSIQKDIQTKLKNKINKNQKEYFLREQLKIIEDALGDKGGVKGEVNEYKSKLEKINPPDYVKEKVKKELNRMLKMPVGSSESVVVRNYVEWVLDLPWNTSTVESYNLLKAEEILDKDHYGLEKVKERIIEYLAVRKLAPKSSSPILCLVGPPGVGKTSIAGSIAKALNRKYVRISLGGVRDEAEIRGHRRTYVGSMPGRIITAYKQVKSNNPLMLLDEIDKMSSDFRGDPTAALLEVLDAEQNNKFRDHFIELPFDLSNTLFIITANTLQNISRPLLDRLEIIRISSYMEDEKLNIAKKYLLKKQMDKHGLKKGQVRIDYETIKLIINKYTKEAGVRELERKIGDICRKSVKQILNEDRKYIKITKNNIEKYLGSAIYRYDKILDKSDVGIARGLAWTPVGGDTLSIEVNTMKGTGKFELTGQLGDVMKESAKTAISYIRSKQKEFDIDEDFYKELDIHIHIPEGAVPKDGPSAGITMATAMISALTGKPIRNDIGMTGEITLRGRVLPIGGLKEKLLAAKRAGIKKVLVPIDNEKNVKEINEKVLKGLQIVFVKTMDEVLDHALVK